MTTPPFAVPSSFVEHEAGEPEPLVEDPGLGDAVLAGRRVQHEQRPRAAPPEHWRPMTRLTLASSAIRFAFVWSRPAVSTIRISEPRACAAFTASKATADGSAPGPWLTTGTPIRSPQRSSCSIAAARNVSPAPRRTEWPSWRSRQASFPHVVVFPEPFTPTTSTIAGRASSSSGAPAPASASRRWLGQRPARVAVGEAPQPRLLPHPLDEPLGGVEPEVGLEQERLEILHRRRARAPRPGRCVRSPPRTRRASSRALP